MSVSKSEAGRPHVLIVDDDPSVREILRVILRQDGWTVDTAEDGDEAIRMLGQSEYSVVLLDLLMPRMRGGAVIDFIRERGIRTPVVVISSAAEGLPPDPNIVRVAFQKPFEVSDLRQVLRALLAAGRPDPSDSRVSS